MRWIPERAKALLHLRCIELNSNAENSSPGPTSNIRTNSVTDKQFRFARTSRQCYCLGQRENACSKMNCTLTN